MVTYCIYIYIYIYIYMYTYIHIHGWHSGSVGAYKFWFDAFMGDGTWSLTIAF